MPSRQLATLGFFAVTSTFSRAPMSVAIITRNVQAFNVLTLATLNQQPIASVWQCPPPVNVVSPAALPMHGPHIQGARKRYRAGETVHLNCTSGKSKPAPVLRWFINGALVTDFKLQSDLRTVQHDDGFQTVSRSLHFAAEEELFEQDEEVKVKCEVSVPSVYVMSDEKILRERMQDSVVDVKDINDDCLSKIISFISRLWIRENESDD